MAKKRHGRKGNKNNNNAQDTNAAVNQAQYSDLSNIVVVSKENQLKKEEVFPEPSNNTVAKQDCESEVTGQNIQQTPNTKSKRARKRINAAIKKNLETVSIEVPPVCISGVVEENHNINLNSLDVINELKKEEVVVELPNNDANTNTNSKTVQLSKNAVQNDPKEALSVQQDFISADSKLIAIETKPDVSNFSDKTNAEQGMLVEENKMTDSRSNTREDVISMKDRCKSLEFLGNIPEDLQTNSESAGSTMKKLYNFLPKFEKATNEIKANSTKRITRFSLSVKADVKLKTCENAWRPSHIETAEDINQEQQKTNTLYKNFRSMLNKLTPEKFQILANKILLLDIGTSERLRGVIDMIFEKSVSEPKFSTVYANLCFEMANIVIFEENQLGEIQPRKFNYFLIARCQKEFEKKKESDELRNKKLIEIQNCVDPVEKKVLQNEFEEYETNLRKKSVGAVKFIGELYKQNMLTPNIMLGCLKSLILAGDEESLEGLCKLLTTVGQMLDKTLKENVTEIMNSMHQIATKKPSEVSSRIRFMLLDSIDLRLNGWVPRLETSAPKKIMEINMEAQNEEFARMSFPDPMPYESNDTRRESTDEQQTVQQLPKFKVEFSRLKRTNTPPAINDLGKTNPFQKWANGSQCTRRQTSSNTNLYENLYYSSNNIWQDTIMNKQVDSIRGSNSGQQYRSCDNLNFSNRLSDSFSANKRNDFPKQSLPSLHRATSNVTISESASNLRPMRYSLSKDVSSASLTDVSLNLKPTFPLKKAISTAAIDRPASKPESMTPEVIAKYGSAFKNTVEEYCAGNCSIKECEQEFQDIPGSLLPQIIEDTILTNLERSKTARTRTGEILALLLKSKIVAKKDFSGRLKTVFSYWEDFVIDIPTFWEFLGEVLVPLVHQEIISFLELSTLLDESAKDKCGARLLASIRQEISNVTGYEPNPPKKKYVKLADSLEGLVVDFPNKTPDDFLCGVAHKPSV